jgi:histone H3/H4
MILAATRTALHRLIACVTANLVPYVQRIMMLDDDVSRVSAGGVRAIAAATELWLGKMAERALGVAASSKRKTLKFSDIQTVRLKEHPTWAGVGRTTAGVCCCGGRAGSPQRKLQAVRVPRRMLDVQVATKDRRLGDMGLQDIYDHEDTFAEARGDGEHGDENGEGKVCSTVTRQMECIAQGRYVIW